MILYNKIIKVGILCISSLGVCAGLTGCFGSKPAPLPEFKAKALGENARGITIASGKPYNCKIVGETEGQDEVTGKVKGVTKVKIRQGAINDLKNESSYAIKQGQKVMISISKEEMKCKEYPTDKKGNILWKNTPKEKDCTSWEEIPANAKIISYKVYGDLYDCGEK